MDKFTFITELRAKLWPIPEEDRQRSVDYYAEMIDDRMEEGLSEEAAVAAIGNLDEIVGQILEETPPVPVEVAAPKKRRSLRTWEIVLLVLGAPLWIPLLIAVFAVVLSVVVALWSVVISLYATSFALAASAIGLLIGAASLGWIRRFAECAVTLGGSLVCAGCAILLFMLSNLAARGMAWISKQIFQGIGAMFAGKEHRA